MTFRADTPLCDNLLCSAQRKNRRAQHDSQLSPTDCDLVVVVSNCHRPVRLHRNRRGGWGGERERTPAGPATWGLRVGLHHWRRGHGEGVRQHNFQPSEWEYYLVKFWSLSGKITCCFSVLLLSSSSSWSPRSPLSPSSQSPGSVSSTPSPQQSFLGPSSELASC